MTRHTTRLRELIGAPEILVAPGAYDGTGARLAQELGFRAIYLSGFQTSASVLGRPDVGYLTLTQMVARVAAFAEAVDLPLIADADTGYGNPLNVRRAVREYEAAGAAAMHIEDQTFPKRCGHMLGRHVIAEEDMIQKIRAAVDARRDPDFTFEAILDDAIALGGTVTGEHGVGLLKKRGMHAELGEDVLALHRAIKSALDPAGILNPGKVI
ncbi:MULTISPECIES: isocitrate lyase/phosphoenolpyruvate mutase family protein [unclassified Nonomuraea]|uniref:isocitrate lyase/phosphoenolpyruvate mutase family protein n=1 Tax=unclassified Nonomuraea TaxID=2593643 RepID=UPI0035C0A229